MGLPANGPRGITPEGPEANTGVTVTKAPYQPRTGISPATDRGSAPTQRPGIGPTSPSGTPYRPVPRISESFIERRMPYRGKRQLSRWRIRTRAAPQPHTAPQQGPPHNRHRTRATPKKPRPTGTAARRRPPPYLPTHTHQRNKPPITKTTGTQRGSKHDTREAAAASPHALARHDRAPRV